jgi:hypothetical protein
MDARSLGLCALAMATISGAGTFPAGGLSAAQGRANEKTNKDKRICFMRSW